MPDEVRADPADLLSAAEGFYGYPGSSGYSRLDPWAVLTEPDFGSSLDRFYGLDKAHDALDAAHATMSRLREVFTLTSNGLYRTAFAYYEADRQAAEELDYTPPIDGPL